MNLYRGLLQRAAQELPKKNNVLNLCIEFRSDKNAKAVLQRAKSILAADTSFFSATSPIQRIRGPELHERLMRKLVETMLSHSNNDCLTVTQAYNHFCRLAELRQLGSIKRSVFKTTMVDLMLDRFGLALRRDVPDALGKHQEAWKGVKLLETDILVA